jgi:hypothetical protein
MGVAMPGGNEMMGTSWLGLSEVALSRQTLTGQPGVGHQCPLPRWTDVAPFLSNEFEDSDFHPEM